MFDQVLACSKLSTRSHALQFHEAIEVIIFYLVQFCYAFPMQFTVDIPDQLVGKVIPHGQDASRRLLEEAVAGAYRDRLLTMEQVRSLLNFGTRMQVDAFLQQHEIFDYTANDLDSDMATMHALLQERESQQH
jgi:hypothetical protein